MRTEARQRVGSATHCHLDITIIDKTSMHRVGILKPCLSYPEPPAPYQDDPGSRASGTQNPRPDAELRGPLRVNKGRIRCIFSWQRKKCETLSLIFAIFSPFAKMNFFGKNPKMKTLVN